MNADMLKRAKCIVKKHSVDRGLCGVSVSVSRKASTNRFEHAEGFKDLDNFELMQPGSIFRIASISKSMTATLMMIILKSDAYNADDKLSVDSTIMDVLKYSQSESIIEELSLYPIFKDKANKRSYLDVITLKMLLVHRSGLRHYKANEEYLHLITNDSVAKWNALHADKEATTARQLKGHRLYFLCRFGNEELLNKPDEKFVYSSYGYQMVGLLIEQITNLSYFQAINKLLFKPCHMQRAAALYDDLAKQGAFETGSAIDLHDVVDNVAKQYVRTFNTIKKAYKDTTDFDLQITQGVDLLSMKEKGAGGGLLMSADDVTRFMDEVVNGSNGVISKEMSKYILSYHTDSNKVDYHYGIGLFLHIDCNEEKCNDQVEEAYHSGGAIGGCAYTRAWLKDDVIITVLTNVQTTLEPLVDIARELKELVTNQPLKITKKKSHYDMFT